MTATLQVRRGVTVDDACQGQVTFTLEDGSRMLARRHVSLNAHCQATATVSLADKTTGLRVQAAFAGNRSVTSRSVVADAH